VSHTHSEAITPIDWLDATTRFVAYLVEQERSGLTVRTYRDDLDAFADWYATTFESRPELARMTSIELREWKTNLREVKTLSPATTNRKLSAVRSFLRWAESEGLAPPVKTPKSVRMERQPPRWLSRKDQLAFMRAAARSSTRDGAIATVLLHTGARVSELAGAKWRDVEITQRKGSITLHGKGQKDRIVPLNAEARAALAALGYPGRDDAPIVHGQRGAMTDEGIMKVIAGIAAEARLDDCTCHTLRHTFCRRLAEAGTRLEQIAALAGHESLDTTRRYVEPGKEELAAAVERLAGDDD